MFDFIEGIVATKQINYVVINVGGVGYRLEVPLSSLDKIAAGKRLKLYAHTIVRNDSYVLYGFTDQKERRFFQALIRVNSVGPKLALSILGTLSLAELTIALQERQPDRLVRVPSVGKKVARRLVNEMADFVEHFAEIEDAAAYEAEHALIALGYKAHEASGVIRRIKKSNMTTEQLVRQALKDLTTQQRR